jgi:hypothetical protein
MGKSKEELVAEWPLFKRTWVFLKTCLLDPDERDKYLEGASIILISKKYLFSATKKQEIKE